ncbi:Hypothetical_protein [Hexamita inflata]|uniref:Hypothetical_protein n=1 Tax=Hexamita inflata TaxID=28002 RepID=A0ABP1GZH2_9EUKA
MESYKKAEQPPVLSKVVQLVQRVIYQMFSRVMYIIYLYFLIIHLNGQYLEDLQVIPINFLQQYYFVPLNRLTLNLLVGMYLPAPEAQLLVNMILHFWFRKYKQLTKVWQLNRLLVHIAQV